MSQTTEKTVPISELNDLVESLTEHANENSEHEEYAIGVSHANDKLRQLIEDHNE